MKTLNNIDVLAVYEIARVALSDADFFEKLSDELDLSYDYLSKIRDNLEEELNKE